MSVSKMIGYILVFSGCSGLGAWYSMQLHKRLKNIREMIRILDIVLSEIQYGKSTLMECCEQIRDRAAAPYCNIFRKLADDMRLEKGVNFKKSSIEYIKEGLADLPLQGEQEIFCKCFSDVGYGDDWIQKRSMERGKQELQKLLDMEEQDLIKQSRLAVRLGAMCGILLVLIFI